MDLSEFATLFPQKMEELTRYVEGDEICDMFGIEETYFFS